MEISEIKSLLTIAQVLEHYLPTLKLRQAGGQPFMIHCPFHEDKTPSMQVYPETNTVHCFSANCKVNGKAIDVIDFILHKEGISKHEAILKAKELAGYKEPDQPFEKLFKVFQAALKKSEKAQVYLKERGIEKAQAGFNDGTWENLKHCVVFALRDRKEKIVSLYGRSIHNNDEARHFYTRNRKGLYPGYPPADTKLLILTEAIIDAATLAQHTDYTTLACYGTNGFTTEHEQAIRELKQLEEVVIFFDGDDAGREGARKIADKLHGIRPDIKLSQVTTPEGEDVNSLVHSHETGILAHLIENRTPFIFSIEKKTPTPVSNHQLDTSNPLRLTYRTVTANYYVKGGLRNEADSMRVSLDIERGDNNRKSRSKVDLYEDKQVEKVAREAAEKLQLRADLIQLDLEVFTELLEQYRERQSNPRRRRARSDLHISMKSRRQSFYQDPN